MSQPASPCYGSYAKGWRRGQIPGKWPGAPHLVRRLLAETMDIPEHRVRVIAPDVGGGFGSKLHFYAEEALCAFLARELGRPVKWCETRGENFLATTHGRDHIQDVEIAALLDMPLKAEKVWRAIQQARKGE